MGSLRLSRLNRLNRLLIALTLAVPASTLQPDQATAATCRGWRFSQGIALGRAGPDSRLLDVVARSARDAWAVGYSGYWDGRTLIEHWDGRAWRRTASPNHHTGRASRNAFVAVTTVPGSPHVWAVGSSSTDTGYPDYPDPLTSTLAARWDGRAWRKIPSAGPGDFNGFLAVHARSATDVWAVGAWVDSREFLNEHTLIQRWSGGGWQGVPSPAPGPVELTGVTAISATDVWAVGNGGGRAFVLHWDGQEWTSVQIPDAAARGKLNAITARGADDVIAVGAVGRLPLMLHFDGDDWRVARTPTAGSLDDVSTSGGDVWAAGTRPGGRAWRTLLLRWNGQAWRTVWTPNATSRSNRLTGVTVAPDGAIFAVGEAQRRDRKSLPLVLQHCGH